MIGSPVNPPAARRCPRSSQPQGRKPHPSPPGKSAAARNGGRRLRRKTSYFIWPRTAFVNQISEVSSDIERRIWASVRGLSSIATEGDVTSSTRDPDPAPRAVRPGLVEDQELVRLGARGTQLRQVGIVVSSSWSRSRAGDVGWPGNPAGRPADGGLLPAPAGRRACKTGPMESPRALAAPG